jgi:hypothetical protein
MEAEKYFAVLEVETLAKDSGSSLLNCCMFGFSPKKKNTTSGTGKKNLANKTVMCFDLLRILANSN